MPPIPTGVRTGPDFIRPAFYDTYARRREALNGVVGQVMDLDLPSDRLTERYYYNTRGPLAHRRDRGEPRRRGAFKGVTWTVTNHTWEVGIGYHEEDVEDDVTGTVLRDAQRAGEALPELVERVFYQFMQAGTDADLLPSIPNAPDGAASYSATDGDAANRFGVSGGNIVASQTYTTPAGWRAQLAAVSVRFRQFLDTESQPLLPDSLIKRFILFYPIGNENEVLEAFLLRQIVGTVTSPGNLAASISNVHLEAGRQVLLVGSSRVTASTAYWFLPDVTPKAFFTQLRRPVREILEDQQNSDRARDSMENAIYMDERRGYGAALPLATIKTTT